MKFRIFFFLFLSGCASCDYEETHAFMKANDFTEICYTVSNDKRIDGNYCLRRIK